MVFAKLSTCSPSAQGEINEPFNSQKASKSPANR